MMNGIYALEWSVFEQVEALMRLDISAVERLTAMAAKMDVSAGPATRAEAGGTIAIVPVHGVIEQRRSVFGMLFGGTSVTAISGMLRQAEDESVRAVVLDLASPGGEVFAVSELAHQIMAMREKKPVVAIHNRFAASAGYWISSAASEIVAPNDAMQGSIGVYKVHTDISEAEAKAGIKRKVIAAGEFKADAVDGAPMSDEGERAAYEMVNHIYAIMRGDIAGGRRTTAAKVDSDFGKGLLMTAPAALAAGMIDRIGTMDETLKRLSTPQGRAAVMRAEYVEPVVDDGEAERRIRRARATV